jgi:hypothetical protein
LHHSSGHEQNDECERKAIKDEAKVTEATQELRQDREQDLTQTGPISESGSYLSF